jgi:hypothetical protein
VEQVVSGNTAFVRRTGAGTRILGYYHRLRQEKHSEIEALFSLYRRWAYELDTAGLSAGTYISVEGAGTGCCVMITKSIGPFVSS